MSSSNGDGLPYSPIIWTFGFRFLNHKPWDSSPAPTVQDTFIAALPFSLELRGGGFSCATGLGARAVLTSGSAVGAAG